jgi:hypothetical protein
MDNCLSAAESNVFRIVYGADCDLTDLRLCLWLRYVADTLARSRRFAELSILFGALTWKLIFQVLLIDQLFRR